MAGYIQPIKPSVIEQIQQPYPEIRPFTLFQDIDYISWDYADILDSIAIILALWFATGVIMRLSHAIYGKTTQTVALRELIDRLMTFDVSSFVSLRKRTYSPPRVQYFSNLNIRLLSIFFALILFGVDALLIFSQTSKTLGFNDLKLKQLGFKPPSGPVSEYYIPYIGLTWLIDSQLHNWKVPLYLETYSLRINSTDKRTEHHHDIYFISDGERYFRIQYHPPMHGLFEEFRFSIQLRDESKSLTLFVNLTTCGFNMTESKISWLTNQLKGISPGANISHSRLSKTTTHMYGNNFTSPNTTYDFNRYTIGLALSMFQKSKNVLKTHNFISSDGSKLSTKDKLFLDAIPFGKVKRFSGIILWIIAAILGMLKVFVERKTWDMDEDVNTMVAASLSISRSDSLRFGSNKKFRIVDLRIVDDQEDETNERELMEEWGHDDVAGLKLEEVP